MNHTNFIGTLFMLTLLSMGIGNTCFRFNSLITDNPNNLIIASSDDASHTLHAAFANDSALEIRNESELAAIESTNIKGRCLSELGHLEWKKDNQNTTTWIKKKNNCCYLCEESLNLINCTATSLHCDNDLGVQMSIIGKNSCDKLWNKFLTESPTNYSCCADGPGEQSCTIKVVVCFKLYEEHSKLKSSTNAVADLYWTNNLDWQRYLIDNDRYDKHCKEYPTENESTANYSGCAVNFEEQKIRGKLWNEHLHKNESVGSHFLCVNNPGKHSFIISNSSYEKLCKRNSKKYNSAIAWLYCPSGKSVTLNKIIVEESSKLENSNERKEAAACQCCTNDENVISVNQCDKLLKGNSKEYNSAISCLYCASDKNVKIDEMSIDGNSKLVGGLPKKNNSKVISSYFVHKVSPTINKTDAYWRNIQRKTEFYNESENIFTYLYFTNGSSITETSRWIKYCDKFLNLNNSTTTCLYHLTLLDAKTDIIEINLWRRLLRVILGEIKFMHVAISSFEKYGAATKNKLYFYLNMLKNFYGFERGENTQAIQSSKAAGARARANLYLTGYAQYDNVNKEFLADKIDAVHKNNTCRCINCCVNGAGLKQMNTVNKEKLAANGQLIADNSLCNFSSFNCTRSDCSSLSIKNSELLYPYGGYRKFSAEEHYIIFAAPCGWCFGCTNNFYCTLHAKWLRLSSSCNKYSINKHFSKKKNSFPVWKTDRDCKNLCSLDLGDKRFKDYDVDYTIDILVLDKNNFVSLSWQLIFRYIDFDDGDTFQQFRSIFGEFFGQKYRRSCLLDVDPSHQKILVSSEKIRSYGNFRTHILISIMLYDSWENHHYCQSDFDCMNTEISIYNRRLNLLRCSNNKCGFCNTNGDCSGITAGLNACNANKLCYDIGGGGGINLTNCNSVSYDYGMVYNAQYCWICYDNIGISKCPSNSCASYDVQVCAKKCSADSDCLYNMPKCDTTLYQCQSCSTSTVSTCSNYGMNNSSVMQAMSMNR